MTALRIHGTLFTEGHEGDLACRHRDLSVCPVCFADTPGLVDVYGAVYVDGGVDQPFTDEEIEASDGAIRRSGPTDENLAAAAGLRSVYAEQGAL